MHYAQWRPLVGPLLTLISVLGIHVVDHYLFAVPSPAAVLALTVVISAASGGLSRRSDPVAMGEMASSDKYAAVVFVSSKPLDLFVNAAKLGFDTPPSFNMELRLFFEKSDEALNLT